MRSASGSVAPLPAESATSALATSASTGELPKASRGRHRLEGVPETRPSDAAALEQGPRRPRARAASRDKQASFLNNVVCDFRGVSVAWLKRLGERVLAGEMAPDVQLVVLQREAEAQLLSAQGEPRGESCQLAAGTTAMAWPEQWPGLLHVPYFGYVRVDRPDVLAPKPREMWETEDVCEYVVKANEVVQSEQTTYLHVIEAEDRSAVGPVLCGAFVSQARRTRFADLVAAVVSHYGGEDLEGVFVWLDMFGANQALLSAEMTPDQQRQREAQLCKGLHDAIRRFDQCLVFFDSWRSPKALTRAWCLWELGGAARFRSSGEASSCAFEILFAPAERERFVEDGLTLHFNDIADCIARMDVRSAECFSKADHDMIHADIAANVEGGHAKLNQLVAEQIQAWLAETALKAVAVRRQALLSSSDDARETGSGAEGDGAVAPAADLRERYALLLNSTATLLETQGSRLDLAQQLFEEAKSVLETTSPGGKHVGVASALHGLGVLCRRRGSLGTAVTKFQEALSIKREILGERDTSVAATLNNLAAVYTAQGMLAEASATYLEALAIKRDTLGDDDVSVALTLGNLGTVYKSMGNLDAALDAFERSLAIKRTKLGPRHPSLAQAMHQMASLFKALDRLEEASAMYGEALVIARESGHRRAVGDLLNDLANVRMAQGDAQGARGLYEEALECKRKLLGEEHVSVASTMQNLATALEALRELDSALEMHEKALRIKRTKLGEHHASVVASLQNMAIVYQRQGSLERARELYEEAARRREAQLGPEHPSVAEVRFNLCQVHLAQGRVEEGLTMARRVARVFDKQLGSAHAKSRMVAELIAEASALAKKDRE